MQDGSTFSIELGSPGTNDLLAISGGFFDL